ncbi:MAG: glycosyltransferase [Candidatus Baltobacteraceae bacterium]
MYQRPQHVLSRFAQAGYRVYFFEEPLFEDTHKPYLRRRAEGSVSVMQPIVPSHLKRSAAVHVQRALLDTFLAQSSSEELILWYYTPMALEFSSHLRAIRVYDCMDELSLFAGAPAALRLLESELLERTDVVFTGGRSLYYNKRRLHGNVHCFPSAVDAAHFAPARRPDPAELKDVPHPRIGFYGVLDERLDTEFVRVLAGQLPEWHVVLVGPVVKIDPAALPQAPNIHYVGMQPYQALPAFLEHWDVAMLPFARNEATRFISPTKTLEYLAARKPVISTPIADVVDPYGTNGLVHIAANGSEAAQIVHRLRGRTPSAQ